MLSKKSIEKFIELYESEFNIKLSEKEAIEKATELLGLYRAIFNDGIFEHLPINKKQNE